MRAYILKKKVAEEKELDTIHDEIEVEVQESIDFAEKSPWPDASELYTDVYVDPIWSEKV
jgi:pyruvate dehydrogenase E1 component alpha subunit